MSYSVLLPLIMWDAASIYLKQLGKNTNNWRQKMGKRGYDLKHALQRLTVTFFCLSRCSHPHPGVVQGLSSPQQAGEPPVQGAAERGAAHPRAAAAGRRHLPVLRQQPGWRDPHLHLPGCHQWVWSGATGYRRCHPHRRPHTHHVSPALVQPTQLWCLVSCKEPQNAPVASAQSAELCGKAGGGLPYFTQQKGKKINCEILLSFLFISTLM